MSDLLRAYDDQLRGERELASANGVRRLGPLWIGAFAGGHGFITTRTGGAELAALVPDALAAALEDPSVRVVEWKTRGHDDAPGLLDALTRHGFVAAEPESIMIGDAAALAVEVAIPDGVRVRAVTAEAEVRAASAVADEVFGDPVSDARADDLLRRIRRGDEMWIAEAGDEIVTVGRLSPVDGTAFAGIWGGATRPAWRGRGIYRAMTAERARSAIRLGKRWITSDSTGFSRPILERSGLTRVSETTPYEFVR